MTRYRLIDLQHLDQQLEAWRQGIWAQRLATASDRNGRPSGLSPPPTIKEPDPSGPVP